MPVEKTVKGIRITIARNYDEMSSIAARIILERITANPSLSLLVPTGTTYKGVYEILSSHPHKDIFRNLKFFNMDEYCLVEGRSVKLIPSTDRRSYRFFMQRHLFDHIGPAESFFPGVENAKREGAYDELIKNHGGIDLCLNAMGEDGHVFGFNFPGTPFSSRTRLVRVNPETSGVNERLTGVETPSHAITIGLKTGMDAREVLFLVSGKRKASKLREAIFGPITEKVPASVKRQHGNCHWIVDEDAASELGI
jgi:glucosamine-6-phosphate deaminase